MYFSKTGLRRGKKKRTRTRRKEKGREGGWKEGRRQEEGRMEESKRKKEKKGKEKKSKEKVQSQTYFTICRADGQEKCRNDLVYVFKSLLSKLQLLIQPLSLLL